MRIVGGTLRGLTLAEVGAGDTAAHLRPTTDRVREALFNLLAHRPGGDPVAGARVLDLFAGTGALGLEALSRGAAQVTFVDDGATARALIRENIDKARAHGTTRLYRRDATALGPNRGAAFDLLFLDPPYGTGLGEAAVASALEGGWLAPGALVAWEDSQPPVLPAGLTPEDERRYGDTRLTFARVADA
ncbi:16S rRNA (guanine(966)-N(2))-methyltransferase RsmD [Mesobaculum littorinae]|uniref:16S rRNA (Guanine(966)-N(2))-methyltransferase RsmD n=1 Tax=Mesobaculum littorinae TaxID=2486419 RepID=A0A438AGN0_9RHOB|nr:16S rRNA (guanine(966)-N(2))-methyltransferase RsmD [Mesobaculum littorinae]